MESVYLLCKKNDRQVNDLIKIVKCSATTG